MKELVGKIVTVKVLDRDEKGKKIPKKFTTMKGLCTFFGKNLLGQTTITIGRTPLFPITYSDIVKIE